MTDHSTIDATRRRASRLPSDARPADGAFFRFVNKNTPTAKDLRDYLALCKSK